MYSLGVTPMCGRSDLLILMVFSPSGLVAMNSALSGASDVFHVHGELGIMRVLLVASISVHMCVPLTHHT